MPLFLLLALIFISSYATSEFAILIPEKTTTYLDIADEIHSSSKEKSSILDPLEFKNNSKQYDFFVSIGDAAYDVLLELAPSNQPKISAFIQRREDSADNVMRVYNDFDIDNQLKLIQKLSTKKPINVGLITSSKETVFPQTDPHADINIRHKPYDREERFFSYLKRHILSSSLDFIILAPSSDLTTSQASLLMVYALEKNIPVIGYTEGIVANGSGATASVYFDKELVLSEIMRLVALFNKGQFIYGSTTPQKGKVITNDKLVKRFGLNSIVGGSANGK